MNEIGDNEKIDIIPFEDDIENYIRNALSPAEVSSVEVDEENKRAKVFVTEDQQNVRLASRLTGYEIDIETKQANEVIEKPRKNIEDSLFSALEENGQ